MMPRNRTVDIIRGIAILAIIAGHLNIWAINRIVFTFHVPVFYLLTGYYVKKEPLFPFIKKKAKSLLIPYTVTCLVIILLSAIITFFSGENVVMAMKDWLVASLYGAGDSYTEPLKINAIGAIWFLWATFWGSIFLQLCLRLKAAFRTACVVGLFAIGYLTSQKMFWFPLSIQAGCCATLFMYVGYCVRQKIGEIKRFPAWIKTTGSVMALVAWLSFIFSFHSFWLVHNDFGRGIVDIARSLCACYCVVLISVGMNKSLGKTVETLAFLGRYSLIVLCVHIIELNLIKWGILINWFESMGMPYLAGCAIALALKVCLILSITMVLIQIRKKLPSAKKGI